jgi:hypothetical protein
MQQTNLDTLISGGKFRFASHVPPVSEYGSRVHVQKPGTDVMIFKNIFAEKFSEKNLVFLTQNKAMQIMKKFDHNIVF